MLRWEYGLDEDSTAPFETDGFERREILTVARWQERKRDSNPRPLRQQLAVIIAGGGVMLPRVLRGAGSNLVLAGTGGEGGGDQGRVHARLRLGRRLRQ